MIKVMESISMDYSMKDYDGNLNDLDEPKLMELFKDYVNKSIAFNLLKKKKEDKK